MRSSLTKKKTTKSRDKHCQKNTYKTLVGKHTEENPGLETMRKKRKHWYPTFAPFTTMFSTFS